MIILAYTKVIISRIPFLFPFKSIQNRNSENPISMLKKQSMLDIGTNDIAAPQNLPNPYFCMLWDNTV